MAEAGASGVFAVFARADAGVDLFFVISGFIIFATAHRPGQTSVSFLSARFWRVVPPYWAALSLYLGAAAGLAVLTGEQQCGKYRRHFHNRCDCHHVSFVGNTGGIQNLNGCEEGYN